MQSPLLGHLPPPSGGIPVPGWGIPSPSPSTPCEVSHALNLYIKPLWMGFRRWARCLAPTAILWGTCGGPFGGCTWGSFGGCTWILLGDAWGSFGGCTWILLGTPVQRAQGYASRTGSPQGPVQLPGDISPSSFQGAGIWHWYGEGRNKPKKHQEDGNGSEAKGNFLSRSLSPLFSFFPPVIEKLAIKGCIVA